MPKFEDLPFLKDKIASIADETEIMEKKGRTPNLMPLPQEEKLEPSESYDDLLSDGLLDDIPDDQEEDLAASAAKEKERSRSLEEAMEQNGNTVSRNEGDFLDNLEAFLGENSDSEAAEPVEENKANDSDSLIIPDNEAGASDESPSLDELSSLVDEVAPSKEETSPSGDEPLPNEALGTAQNETFGNEPNETDFLSVNDNNDPIPEASAADDIASSDFGGLEDLSVDGDLQNDGDFTLDDSLVMDDIPEIKAIDNDGILSGDFDMDSLLSTDNLSDFDNLDAMPAEPVQEQESVQEQPKEEAQEVTEDEGDTLIPEVPEISDVPDIPDISGISDLDTPEIPEISDVAEIPEISDISEAEPAQETESQPVLSDDEALDALPEADDSEDLSNTTSTMPDLPSLSLDSDDDEIDLSSMLSDSAVESADDNESLLDLSSLDDLSLSDDNSSSNNGLPDLDSLDLSGEETPAADNEPKSTTDSSSFEPEDDYEDEEDEQSEDDESDEKIELTPEDRKKVIVTILTFPKEAEIKIAKAIVNPKYSEAKVFPLVKELIKHGEREDIIAQYEKLTGDKSLHNVGLTRMTGEEFERKQKSFIRVIEKNVLPILARAAALIVMIAVLVMFYVTILYPTYTAGKFYKLGKKNIDENKYEYAEQNFSKAYQIQPRYGEIIAYARKFRDHERNFAAERKYEMAAQQRDDRLLDFEYAGFLRDIGKYEKSLSMYNYWVDKNRKDLDARNGRGETYLKWAEIEPSKLEDAENEFLDVLDYKLNNATAINNLLLTYIKMDNRKKVLDTYHWAAAYLKKQDYKTQIKTAGYLIDSGDLNEARRILTGVGSLVPKKPPYPEYDYQMARYNKALLVRPDERKNLESAKAKMEMLSGSDVKRIFGSEKAFNRFQADVYNDLGENYYETSRSDIRAFKMFDRAVSLNPDFGKAYYNLGNFAYLTKADREEALRYYTEAEAKGFSNDIMNYNMGWLYYKKSDYDKAYTKIDNLLKKSPDADSLKFMKGTILLNMLQYDLAYSELLGVYEKFNTFRQGNGPLDLDIKEHRNAVKMLYQSSNNLGAALYGKYKRTKRYQYFVDSLKYFTEAVKYFDIADPVGVPRTHSGGVSEKAVPYLNLKMALYPDVFGKTENALIDDDFNQYEYFY